MEDRVSPDGRQRRSREDVRDEPVEDVGVGKEELRLVVVAHER
jgi:hypothetical protein